jgi:hypothetical protein
MPALFPGFGLHYLKVVTQRRKNTLMTNQHVKTGIHPDISSASTPPTVHRLTDNGAWCWFQDPRAVYIHGQRERTYAGWVDNAGRLQVGAYDHGNSRIEIVTLRENWGVNDHNTNSLLVLPDNRIMTFYTRHNGNELLSRTTSHPEDIRRWDPEVTVVKDLSITYSHPVHLSQEGRYYVFWRGRSWKPEFSTSTDGKTWTQPKVLIQETGRENHSIRPYLKVVSDGQSEIHLTFTDCHPGYVSGNSVYYLKLKAGRLFRANGDLAGSLDHLPVQHSQSDVVYDGGTAKMRAWIWDIAINPQGHPVIAYTRFPRETDHRYHYACWNGVNWQDTEICPGGPWFPQTPVNTLETEPYYSGGMAIKHADPAVVYISQAINRRFEIQRWVTPDQGRCWSSTPITRHSPVLNVRPVVPRGYSGQQDCLLWMRGEYVHYTNYKTGIWLFAPGRTAGRRLTRA